MKIVYKFTVVVVTLLIASCNSKSDEKSNQSKYLQDLDSLTSTAYERDLFNGNILIAKNDTIVYQKSFGYTNASEQDKLYEESIFNTGSIAKEFNGVSIMLLVEQGKLSLDDHVSKFELGLPSWSKKVTIRHLLNYAGGFPMRELELKNDEIAFKNLRSIDNLLFEPGSSFSYNNYSIFMQQRIIEKVANTTYKEFVIENIVKPLGMKSAIFDPNSNDINRTSCYSLEKITCPEMDYMSGWLWVDINDLYKWIKAMNTNALISQESFDILLRNPFVDDKASALGEYFEEDKLQRHNGTSYKFRSIYLNDLKNDIVVILLANNGNVWDLGHSTRDIMLGKDFTIPKKSVQQALRNDFLEDVDKGIEAYHSLKKAAFDTYSFENPSELNRIGYEVLRIPNAKEAIRVFQFALSEFPDNAYLLDSLAEGYFTNEQYDLALKNYKKSIALGGTVGNAKMMIEKIYNLQKK